MSWELSALSPYTICIQTQQNTVLAASACRDVARLRPRPPERATPAIPGIRKRTPYTVKPGFYITECEMLLAYTGTLDVQCWMLNVVP